MNTPHDAFENELRRVKPAAPSPELMARLRATLPASTKPEPKAAPLVPFWLRFALPLAAAAALVLMVLPGRAPDKPVSRIASVTPDRMPAESPVAPAARQVEASDYLLGARELGVVHAPDGKPYRVVQCVGVSKQVWENEADGRRVVKDLPHQQVLLVAMDTY